MNKLKTIALGLMACVGTLGNTATAQKGTTTYQLLYDDPLAYKKLFINLNILCLDLASPTEWRPGIGAEFMLNKRLYFFGEYNRNFLSTAGSTTHKYQNYLEAATIFSFSANVKQTKAKVHAKDAGYKYRWTIKARALKQFGVHAGINSFSTYKKDGDYFAYANTNSIFGGIAIATTRDMLVKLSSHGTLNRSSRSIIYADVMLAPSIKYIDATDYADYKGSASTATPATFPTFTKTPIGARFGYMKYNSWPISTRSGFELGSRPGIGKPLFFTFRLDISLGFMHGKNEKNEANK